MSGLGLSESEKMEKLSHELSNLKSQGNLSGILFSERSGKLIKALYDNEFDFEEFSSMCASVLESALELGRAMGDKKVKKIITELEQKIIILLECDRKTFLALTITSESHVSYIIDNLNEFIKKLLILV